MPTPTPHPGAPVTAPRPCRRCHELLDGAEAADVHWLEPEEAAEWGAEVGFYHEGCCPECNGPSPGLPPFADFASAAGGVLAYLHERLGFDLWLVASVQRPDWVVVAALDHGYDVKAGDAFRWSDTFCSRMVTADGPRIAPNSHLVSAYATAPMASQLPIGAYLGVPLEGADGAVLGTLCAVHPRPLPPAIRNDQPLVELQARLLASLLVREVAVTTA